jgi:hypothetical protein
MWGLPVLWGLIVAIPLISYRYHPEAARNFLLHCGWLTSIWYLAINSYVSTRYEGYDMASFTVSELSAIGAPTRLLWVLLCTAYPLLMAAFGWGIRTVAAENRQLRRLSIIIIAYCLITPYWPPMNMRGSDMMLTDIMHIAWVGITLLCMLLMMGYGAVAMGIGFRIFTYATIALFIVFGTLTGMESPALAANEPTPTIVIWERINIFLFLQWVAVISVVLLKKPRQSMPCSS